MSEVGPVLKLWLKSKMLHQVFDANLKSSLFMWVFSVLLNLVIFFNTNNTIREFNFYGALSQLPDNLISFTLLNSYKVLPRWFNY